MKCYRWIVVFILTLFCFTQSVTVWASKFELELNEDWAFYNQELLEKAEDSTNEATNVDLPIEFEELNNGDVSGYGTFVKVVQVPNVEQGETLGLELPFTYSAAKVFVNGELYEEVGRVADNAQEHERNLKSVVIPIKVSADVFEIAIQISSFDHIRGGFSSSPILGDWDTIHNSFLWERYLAIFVMTIIFIAGVMTLVIGLLERKEKMYLTFGLFALVVAARGLVAVPFLYHEVPIGLSYEWATRLEYFTTNICFSLYAIFIFLIYNRLFSKWILYPGLLILWTLAGMALFAEVPTFQQAFFSVFSAMVIFIVYNLWIMIRAFVLNLKLAKSMLLGVLFVFVGLIADFLTGMGLINSPPLANFMIAMNVLIVMFSFCFDYVKHTRMVTRLNNQLDEEVKARTMELAEANRELEKLVQLDALTGIYNRHKFNEAIEKTFQLSVDVGQSLSLIMIDVDEFKKFNDYYGHVHGDELLIQVARIMQVELPAEAILARYGGEEFAVILPGFSMQQAAAVGEGVRLAVERAGFQHAGRDVGFVTVSLGCSERIVDDVSDGTALVYIADQRLYLSKEKGRNQLTAGKII